MRVLRNSVLTLAGFALLLFLFRDPILGAAGSYLVNASPPEKADIGLVLAGDGNGNRVLKAGEMVRQGYVPKVVVSGPDSNYGLHECDLAIPFAVKAGYPESSFVHFENSGRSTTEEAHAAIAFLRAMGAHHVLLITSDFHTRRALRTYRAAAPDMEFTMVAAKDRYFSADGWWHNREASKTFLYESMKTVAQWFGI